jgi:hypothetical protein
VSLVPEGLPENLGEATVLIYLTVAIVLFLFVYLLIALVRPEWF